MYYKYTRPCIQYCTVQLMYIVQCTLYSVHLRCTLYVHSVPYFKISHRVTCLTTCLSTYYLFYKIWYFQIKEFEDDMEKRTKRLHTQLEELTELVDSLEIDR